MLGLLSASLSNKEMGRRLRITVQTVNTHVHRILAKLQVHRRREAVRFAYDLGLLEEPREGAALGTTTEAQVVAGPFDGGEKRREQQRRGDPEPH